MARLKVRDRACREFEIDETALPFWKHLVEVVEHIPDPGEEPELAESQPEESGDTKTSKAAARPAREVKE
ncbi:hypothetical protein ACIBHX_02045 [Nonomuraea sp. NPDC050536]|uniref:hypothetical protein n=1 Tax=Nonomuraea sp. NPDC050536 TaxID=3364366 RepID=UPI0037CB1FC5